MLPLDTLTCELVANAIKNDELSCSVPPLEYLELWSTIGDVLTAVVTLLLAVFALLAWLNSRKTLKQMEKASAAQIGEIERQIREQRALIQEQIASQEDLAREERAINALARYMTALRSGQSNLNKYDPNLLPAISEMAVSFTLWAHQVRHVSEDAYQQIRIWHAGSVLYFGRLSTLGG